MSLLFSFILFSCSKDDNGPVIDDGTNTPTPLGSMNAKINGEGFDAIISWANHVENLMAVVGLSSYSESPDAIVLIMENFNGTGRYEMKNDIVNYGQCVFDGTFYISPFENGAGIINVTEYKASESIKGTFNFKAKDSVTGNMITITDGTFNVGIETEY